MTDINTIEKKSDGHRKFPSRVMSGIRTTGTLHIGHYFGAIQHWLKLQEQHTCFFGAMDWHAMTDHYKEAFQMPLLVRETMAEIIARGIDPVKSTLFVQSRVPEHIELFMILSSLTPMGWLERVNTWKDAEEELKSRDAFNLGRFAYPVLQAADIAIYQGTLVPVGKDQVPHIELARDIVGRFNHLYGAGEEILPLPQAVLAMNHLIPGHDGRKMSKSYGNFIPLTEETKDRQVRIRKMPTDPARVHRQDPGDPQKCPVFDLHKLYSSSDDLVWVENGCRTAGIGCGDCKGRLVENMAAFDKEALEKKKQLLNPEGTLVEILLEGCARARDEAQKTLKVVRQAIGRLPKAPKAKSAEALKGKRI